MNDKHKDLNWLKDAIVDYLKRVDMQDSVDIVSYFKLPADVIMNALNQLEDENRVSRIHLSGLKYQWKIN